MRALTEADLELAAELHARALPHGFFPKLGTRFLRSYYRAFMISPSAVGLVADAPDETAGVLVGTLDDRGHYRFLTRKWWVLGPAAAAALARRPRLLLWFLRTRAHRYARGLVRLRRSSPPPPPGARTARPASVLTHLAVLEDHRANGVGRTLVAAFVEQARQAGVAAIRVSTLADSEGAVPFYERLGWTSTGSRHDGEGRSWVDLRLKLD